MFHCGSVVCRTPPRGIPHASALCILTDMFRTIGPEGSLPVAPLRQARFNLRTESEIRCVGSTGAERLSNR